MKVGGLLGLGLRGWEIGGLTDWEIDRLTDWEIDGLTDCRVPSNDIDADMI